MFGQAALSSRAIADQEIVAFNVAEMIGTFTKVNVGSDVLEGTSEQAINFTQASNAAFVRIGASDQLVNFTQSCLGGFTRCRRGVRL